MGIGKNKNTVYFIDFGLSSKYTTDNTSKHREKRTGGRYNKGTRCYKSINCHKNIDQSRRDDIVSLGFLLLYLFTGSLPWENL